MIPEWVDRYEFPFVVHTFDSPEGRMAYIDEGKGPTLIFVHGNASWSYLYRHLIWKLRKEYRCVALDHLGFGLSDKPQRADYSPEAHRRRLSQLIEHLGLESASLVAHDFGGPIALSWAIDNPERVESIILFNTWMWSLRKNPEALHLFKIFDSLANRFFYTWLKASPKFFLPVLMADAHKMPKHDMEQYLFPFGEHKSRSGPYRMARDLVRASTWLEQLWEKRERIENLPMLLLWGENDRISGEHGLQLFATAFPHARPVTLDRTGYFVPQDASRRCIVEMKGFLRSIGAPLTRPGFLE